MDSFLNKHLKYLILILSIINLIIVYIYGVPCPWKTNFNIDCAGCGATRMIKSLLKFDFYQGFRFNPLMFILLIVGIVYIIYIIICMLIKVNYHKLNNRDWLILLILVIMFTVIRNMPGLEFLRPTYIR